MTKKELLAKLKILDLKDNEQKKRVVCSLIGHSMIQTICFGYHYCGRCGAQVGDSLALVYPKASETVIIGHNCDVCRKNYKKMTWKDKFLIEDPFKVEEEK